VRFRRQTFIVAKVRLLAYVIVNLAKKDDNHFLLGQTEV
jgi:hypothetical protein